MKRILYIALAASVLVACKDDNELFSVDISPDAFEFTPVMGGAVMKYTLPADPDIIAINVRYKDVYGNDILKSGSSTTDRLTITGFNEESAGNHAFISYVKRNNEESQPIEVTFNTLDSAPICFINGAEVKSGWNGCTLEYDNPEGTSGMAHVFYVGINPIDNKQDTILLESFPLGSGKDTRNYTPQQKSSGNTIIIRAEDYRGYIVKERVWENIQSFNVEKLDPSKFDIHYGNSLEVPDEKIGLQYLTDGDTKGTAWFQDQNPYHYYTFISRLNGAGTDSEPMYIDLKKLRPTSEVRFYAYRYIGAGKPNLANTNYIGPQYIKNGWANMLPCSVTIYGCRQDIDATDFNSLEWEKLGEFDQAPDTADRERWTYTAATCGGTALGRNTFGTLAKMEAADPIYKSIDIDINKQGNGFRYLKIKFNQVFYSISTESPSITNRETRYLTLHELEIYSDKD